MKTILRICFITLTLAGCASGPTLQTYYGEKKILTIPAINTDANAEIGQTIISKAYVTTTANIPAIIISSEVSDNVNGTGITTLRAGVIPLSAVDESGKYYRDSNATYTVTGGSSVRAGTTGIYVPNDKTQSAVMFHGYGYFGKKPVVGIEYTTTTLENWDADSYKRELVYSGVSQNTISILYREFKNEMARPAFSQELKYDLSQGNTIGYKGARFEIQKATNTEILYKVIKPLD